MYELMRDKKMITKAIMLVTCRIMSFNVNLIEYHLTPSTISAMNSNCLVMKLSSYAKQKSDGKKARIDFR